MVARAISPIQYKEFTMSNVTLVVLGLVVSILGGGACTFILALLRQNEYLKKESASLAQDFSNLVAECDNAEKNWVSNARSSRDYKALAAERAVEIEFWKKEAYKQNQKFLLAAPRLTIAQVEQIEKDIQSL